MKTRFRDYFDHLSLTRRISAVRIFNRRLLKVETKVVVKMVAVQHCAIAKFSYLAC